MKRFLDYNKNLKIRAKELKENMTKPEKRLRFDFLKQLLETQGIKVYKQRLIDNFIVDFYIPKLKLVIEIDWESHFDEQWIAYDIERTAILEWLWLKVIRFTNEEVMKNFEWVCEMLEREFKVV